MSQFQVFMFFLWISGIDSAISYMQGWITNMTDKDKGSRRMYPLVVAGQCGCGYGLTMLFCSNWGWILFDLVDHYMTDYIILIIGILQCVAVGWVLEFESTANRSEQHRESLRALAFWYWIPVLGLSFYANFGFITIKWLGSILGLLCLLWSCGMSILRFRPTGLGMDIWYTEIFLCGVNKVAMSVSTTEANALNRGFCVRFFEFYFGLAIKYLNPAILVFLLCENLNADLAAPYSEVPQSMTVFATMFLFFLVCMLCIPIFLCYDIKESDEWLNNMRADDVAGGAAIMMGGSGPEGSNFDTKIVELPAMDLKQ
jgi:SNF family Na+-dependent transporter